MKIETYQTVDGRPVLAESREVPDVPHEKTLEERIKALEDKVAVIEAKP